MKIYITRHGETDWNRLHKVTGWSDVPLNETGLEQARELASIITSRKDEMDIGHIYVSDLTRARQTASFTEKALGIEAVVDQRLREMNFGTMEGIDWDSEEFIFQKQQYFNRYEGGEDTITLAHRLYTFLDEKIAELRDKDENMLIVCHGTAARVLSTYFRDYLNEEYRKIRVKNCEILEYCI